MDDNSRLLVLDPQDCEICQSITILVLTTKAAPYGLEHHSSKEALLLSANQGCRLCIWVCFASFFEPWLEGQAEKDGTRPPTEGIFPLRSVRHQYAPILRYSKSLRGITILNPYEAADWHALRVYTNYRSFSPEKPLKTANTAQRILFLRSFAVVACITSPLSKLHLFSFVVSSIQQNLQWQCFQNESLMLEKQMTKLCI